MTTERDGDGIRHSVSSPIDSVMTEPARVSSSGRSRTEDIMSKGTMHDRTSRAANSLVHQPRRHQDWTGLSASEILTRYRIGKTPPLKVLEVLIDLFNRQHTAKHKDVSFKTRQERADFLRRFFRDLKGKAGFKRLPDPRNLGERHIKAMVAVWQAEKLAAATIQTYLSFLRGLAQWLGKHGLVRQPHYYGLQVDEYQRHEVAVRDKSWSAQGIDIDGVISEICMFDPYVGAAMRLVRAMGLRRKEAVMFRPHACVMSFDATGLPLHKRKADSYARIKGGSKGGRERFVPLDSVERTAAVEHAQTVVATRDGHMGHPSHTLEQALRRFNYVLEKFGVTQGALGVTAHGLRHEVLIEQFQVLTGHAAPVRGGARLPTEIAAPARQEVAELAGHARKRASSAYLGGVLAHKRAKHEDGEPPESGSVE
ncbi:integrase domain-containing protein [Massilia sp. CMS3.1]|uniref:integrase domain-containing protein n=1 Tax=Massilia sp. CMS3.1 TaxID=3373083 RepID=UPI003EE62534